MNESSNNPVDDRSGIGETITTALRQPSILRVMLGLAATVVVLVGMRLAAPILNPILFAVILALLFSPIYGWLRRHRIPTPLALIIMLVGLTILFLGLFLNAWCELRSPLQQISESQPRTTKLLVEPDTEIVQRYPRHQASSQAFQLRGPLPPEAEGIEELVVDRLHDLAYSSYPSSQALGPVPLAGVALGRVDDAHPVAFQPASMVFFALKALVGYVGSPGRRSHARQPRVRSMPDGEEGLGHLLVGGRSSTEAKTHDDIRRIDSQEQTEALVPSQAIAPSDVCPTGQPSFTSALCISNGHRRTVQGFVRTSLSLHDLYQVQGHFLD